MRSVKLRRSNEAKPNRGRFVVGHSIRMDVEGEAPTPAPIVEVVHIGEPAFIARVVPADQEGERSYEGLQLQDLRWFGGRQAEGRHVDELLRSALIAARSWLDAQELRFGPHAVFMSAIERKAKRYHEAELSAAAESVARAILPELESGLAMGIPRFDTDSDAAQVLGIASVAGLADRFGRIADILLEAAQEAGFRAVGVTVKPDVVLAWLRERQPASVPTLPVSTETLVRFLLRAALIHSAPAIALERVEPDPIVGNAAAHTPVSDDNGAPPEDIPAAPANDPFRYLRRGSVLPPV